MGTERELDVKALLDRPAKKLSEIKTETLAYAFRHVYWTSWRTRFHKCRPKVLPKHGHATKRRGQDTRKHNGR